MQKIFLGLLALTLIVACKDSDKDSKKEVATAENKEPHPGKKLLETNCYICHSPTMGHDDGRIAPPMEAIKRHYKTEGISKEQFIADMQEWIKKPSEDNTKMPGAIRNYGLMPYTPFPEETIKQIADYMYDNDLEAPDWFEDHFNEERGKGMGRGNGRGQGMGMGQGNGMGKNQQKNYADVGLQYALSTKAQLGKNLMGTIQKKGTLDAVTFCNERAYPLTDSMAKVHNATIKRVSDKPRNPNNQANVTELAHILTFKKQVADKVEIKPIVEHQGDKVNFYYPITTNSMCLQCHGKPEEQIKPEVLKTLTDLYPQDKATGYDVDQVRGIWSITFND